MDEPRVLFEIKDNLPIIRDYAPGQFYERGYIAGKLKLKPKAMKYAVYNGVIPQAPYRNIHNEPIYTFAQMEAIIHAYRLWKKGKLRRNEIRAYVEERWNN